MDIIETFHIQKKYNSKLYFKVDPAKLEEDDDKNSLCSEHSSSKESLIDTSGEPKYLDLKYNHKDEADVSISNGSRDSNHSHKNNSRS